MPELGEVLAMNGQTKAGNKAFVQRKVIDGPRGAPAICDLCGKGKPKPVEDELGSGSATVIMMSGLILCEVPADLDGRGAPESSGSTRRAGLAAGRTRPPFPCRRPSRRRPSTPSTRKLESGRRRRPSTRRWRRRSRSPRRRKGYAEGEAAGDARARADAEVPPPRGGGEPADEEMEEAPPPRARRAEKARSPPARDSLTLHDPDCEDTPSPRVASMPAAQAAKSAKKRPEAREKSQEGQGGARHRGGARARGRAPHARPQGRRWRG